MHHYENKKICFSAVTHNHKSSVLVCSSSDIWGNLISQPGAYNMLICKIACRNKQEMSDRNVFEIQAENSDTCI